MQQTLRNLDKAYQTFFNRLKQGSKPGFPRFKSFKRFKSFTSIIEDGCSIKEDKLYIQGIGNLKINKHRELLKDGKPKQVVVKNILDKWYAIFQIEIPKISYINNSNLITGIDLGIDTFATLSDDTKIENPRYYRTSEKKMKRLNRNVSRKKRYSKRWKKAITLLAKHHNHVANQRLDFHHKLSRQLSIKYKTIAIEDLNINNMHDRYLNKSIHDVG